MIVAGSTSPLLLASAGGYNLTKSLRFRSSASAYLNRTPASATNQKTWTWSGWVKRGTLGTYNFGLIFCDTGSNANKNEFGFFNTDSLFFEYTTGGSTQADLKTTQVFRDPSAWYHIVLAVDTTQATASNRIKMYVNGSQITSFSASTYPSQNTDMYINSTNVHDIGRGNRNSGAIYLDAYLTELNFIDGQALTPSSFGETSTTTGVWIPKKFSGTYGTNGFYLPFTDTTSTSTLGTDFSGNSNTWTVNNISLTAGSTYDSMTDVPTNTNSNTANYSVLNPLDIPSNISVSNGNLEASISTTAVWKTICNTISVSSGKWYAEFSTNNTVSMAGIIRSSWNANIADSRFWADSLGYGYYSDTGTKYNNNTSTSYGATYTTNDIIGVALDLDNGTLVFYKNGVSQGTAFTGLTGEFKFAVAIYYSPQVAIANFGQRPFSYTPPTGFVALNTFNLPTPTIGATASTQAITYMGATTYSGDSTSNRVITTGGGSDFVWIKRRNSTTNNILFDVLRGAGATLYSNLTNAEVANGSYYVQTFGNTSFTLGTGGDAADNITGGTYVAWNWKANGAGSSNTQGSITSTVSASTTAGFSIVTYTGSGSAATVGHGLGVAPSMIIIKDRDNGTYDWNVYHASLSSPTTLKLYLNTTDAETNGGTNSGTWNSTAPTSTVFSLGTFLNVNKSGDNFVAYCFAQVAGYSAFGSYTGNGSTDGPFIFTGFRPRYVLIKCSTNTFGWIILDSSRNTYNPENLYLYANASDAEGTFTIADFLSNGFKIRAGSATATNSSGDTFIYMAFAENPFKYANAR